jgi:hypothetical protein
MPLSLNDDGSRDETSQRAVLRYYLSAGAGGVAVGVHSTQFAIRERGLFYDVLEDAVKVINEFEKKNCAVKLKIAGVCGETEQAVAEAETAKALGYDYVLLSPGGLSGYDDGYLIKRSEAVAEILPVIGFYLQTAVGGRRLGYEYWKRFCAIPGVIGVKCAPFNRYQTLDMMRGVAGSGCAGEITLYTGNDDTIVTDLLTRYRFSVNGQIVELKFSGGLLGHWGVWTSKAVQLLNRIHALDGQPVPPELLTEAAGITDCNAAFFDAANNFNGCIPGIHEVLRRQGLFSSIRCLDEAEVLSPGQKEEIDRVYAMYPHLNDDAFVREHLGEWKEQ